LVNWLFALWIGIGMAVAADVLWTMRRRRRRQRRQGEAMIYGYLKSATQEGKPKSQDAGPAAAEAPRQRPALPPPHIGETWHLGPPVGIGASVHRNLYCEPLGDEGPFALVEFDDDEGRSRGRLIEAAPKLLRIAVAWRDAIQRQMQLGHAGCECLYRMINQQLKELGEEAGDGKDER
jgi:hypothetical protein